EEEQIGGKRDDADLQEVELALTGEGARLSTVVAQKQRHHHGRDVKQQQSVARPPELRRGVQNAVVIGVKDLAQRVNGEGNADQPPEAAGKTTGALRGLIGDRRCNRSQRQLHQVAKQGAVQG